MEDLPKKCVDIAIECNKNQDNFFGNLFDAEKHFDGCCFKEGIDYINKQWKKIETLSKNRCDSENLREILCAFGKILHAIQDFYAHSNWVETHDDVWDGKNIPDGLVSGTFLDRGCCPKGQDMPSHGELNKDQPNRAYYTKAIRQAYKHSNKTFELLKTKIPWLEECCKELAGN